ncbi:MAG: LysR family transcriptional regulator [Paracoccaceae bacterium]
MSFESWDEIRTAYQVARMGTVSGAASVLGVHHATVIRHIDALEQRLGAKLFQRHPRGYTPTDAGRALLSVAQGASERFDQLASQIKGQSESVCGELTVTSTSGSGDFFIPALAAFQRLHPDLRIRFLTDTRLFRLSSGEAHVAVRAGTKPEEPDYVVQRFIDFEFGLFASKDYIATHGQPETEADLAYHRFVVPDDEATRAPFLHWLRDRVPDRARHFRVSDFAETGPAIRAGAGIGFLMTDIGRSFDDLVEVQSHLPDWTSPTWLVTHVDLHRTRNVQAFLAHMKATFAGRVGA